MIEDHNLYNQVPFTNIDDEDFIFSIDKVPYLVKRGERRILLKFMVDIALKHLIDKILNKKDPEGKLIAKQEERDKLALQIVGEEMRYEQPHLPTTQELIEEVNKPSDLDRALKGITTVSPLPVTHTLAPEPTPDFETVRVPIQPTVGDVGGTGATTNVTVDTTETQVIPDQPLVVEKFEQIEKEKIKLPSRKEMMDFAKNELKMDTSDEKLIKEWNKLSNQELHKELGME